MEIGSFTAVVEPCHRSCLSVVGSIPVSNLGPRGGGGGSGGGDHVGSCRSSISWRKAKGSSELSVLFSGTGVLRRWRRRRRGDLIIANEIAGQYEDNFNDIQAQMVNYFTYKAVRTVLQQLYEMNPPSYMWFYNYVATNDMKDSKKFLRKLVKEKQDLAERVMITRLHLYGKWIKKCDHAKMYQFISDENLLLMRERLMETVIWPSDDTNTEKIG